MSQFIITVQRFDTLTHPPPSPADSRLPCWLLTVPPLPLHDTPALSSRSTAGTLPSPPLPDPIPLSTPTLPATQLGTSCSGLSDLPVASASAASGAGWSGREDMSDRTVILDPKELRMVLWLISCNFWLEEGYFHRKVLP